MSDLRTEIAAAVLALQTNGLCELGRVCELCDCFSERDGGKNRDEILLREADAALAVVQKRAEQLADELDNEATALRERNWPGMSDHAKREYQIRAEVKRDAAQRIRAAFGLATREESNQ